MPGAIIDVIITWVNEMESPSFEGFDTQIASLCTVIKVKHS